MRRGFRRWLCDRRWFQWLAGPLLLDAGDRAWRQNKEYHERYLDAMNVLNSTFGRVEERRYEPVCGGNPPEIVYWIHFDRKIWSVPSDCWMAAWALEMQQRTTTLQAFGRA